MSQLAQKPDPPRFALQPNVKVRFKSPSLEQFIHRYAADFQRGGMFIRVREPLPAGMPLRFVLELHDGTPLFSGDGTVVWTRAHDSGRPGVAAGMGVRFGRLDRGGQRMLDRILGGRPPRLAPARQPEAEAKVPPPALPEALPEALSGPAPALGQDGLHEVPTLILPARDFELLAREMELKDGWFMEDPGPRRAAEHLLPPASVAAGDRAAQFARMAPRRSSPRRAGRPWGGRGRSRLLALTLEVLPALVFQTFGLGHVYAGHLGRGLGLVLASWALVAVHLWLCIPRYGLVTWPVCWLVMAAFSVALAHGQEVVGASSPGPHTLKI